jgi:hypothetical protein
MLEIFFIALEKLFKISTEKFMRISFKVVGSAWSLLFLLILIAHTY